MGCFLRWDKSVLITTNTLPCSPRTSASASASSAASCTSSSVASFDDFHASRVLPGFQPDSKIRMLQQLRDDAEIVIAVNANDIEKNKVRGDLGITYDDDCLRLIDAFRSLGLYVGGVCITQYAGQSAADAFIKRLTALGVRS